MKSAGDFVRQSLSEMSGVHDVRGRGLMIGFDIDDSITSSEMMKKCQSAGLLVATAG